MISNLSDDEILDILMTSDFNDKLKLEEYVFLIFKFRQFYKVLYGNHQLYKIHSESENRELSEGLTSKNKELTLTQIDRANLENRIEQLLKPRKLSWRERISGRIDNI